ncbi:hypothetical protein [Catenovulum maritimum]|uniref:Lipoprotein n=1 Tax=Catenovulum maritimum TaxID=1513271 RepID=A0A0J8GTY8_9ALTE|nr:hypothetical protein [Catenovulum maritimum]KMT64153.1 hypothetical protein XM47_15895 [Catenovulum maritimum]
MKKLFILSLIMFATGCVSTYKMADSSNAALVEVPSQEFDFQLLGGTSSRYVFIGDIDESGCLSNKARVEPESLRQDGKLAIATDKEVGIMVAANIGNSICSIGVAVKLKPNGQYKANFGMGSKLCGFDLYKLEGTKTSKVELTQLYQGSLSMCKK